MADEGGALFDSSVNASGHKQELERNFSLLEMCGVGITTGNVWAAIGGSVVRWFHRLVLFLFDFINIFLGCRDI